ncbi:WD40 repeat domain-containing protein [Singulisphaera sp. GP187]|uniref:WD40 repeat domain-containing protein n=1 Tax=Singulisphaera sp. GP187 TaxID=1882752 RepID=UPI00094195B5|nr:PD40 domain-containing protein [Singulisphaera sp. GP187]
MRPWDVAEGRELAVLKGHVDQVESVAFSPDSSTLASASWDKTVKLWDAATGKELTTLKGHTVQALGLAFSPDGKTLASSSGRWGDYNYTPGPGEVILWNLADRRPYAIFKGHPDRIFSVAFNPDGKTLASACCDGSIRLWDVPERK